MTDVSVYHGGFRLNVPGFQGLDASGAENQPRYAAMCNADVRKGTVLPFPQPQQVKTALGNPIGTLAVLSRRHYSADSERDVLIAASGGQLWWGLPGDSLWHLLPLPPDWAQDGYQSDAWSCVTYEMNPTGSTSPVDILLISNEKDGMVCIRGDVLTVSKVTTPQKFGVIARYAERVWGTAVADKPDTLWYSAPYDPFDWTQDNDIPEDGAGEIRQPSWDGDSFTALYPFSGQLLAFKSHSAWRVSGTDPGTYVFSQVTGGGTPSPLSPGEIGGGVLLMDGDGMALCDGAAQSALSRGKLSGVFERMNRNCAGLCAACVYRGRYYLSLPLGDSSTPNGVLIYDGAEGCWLLRQEIAASRLLPTEEGLFFAGDETGILYRWTFFGPEEGATAGFWNGLGENTETLSSDWFLWQSGWLTLGMPTLRKCRLRLKLAPVCQEETPLFIQLETERDSQSRIVRFAKTNGRYPIPVTLPFSVSGTRLRIRLSARSTVNWHLSGGLVLEGGLMPEI